MVKFRFLCKRTLAFSNKHSTAISLRKYRRNMQAIKRATRDISFSLNNIARLVQFPRHFAVVHMVQKVVGSLFLINPGFLDFVHLPEFYN
jgi:hypothetical protein